MIFQPFRTLPSTCCSTSCSTFVDIAIDKSKEQEGECFLPASCLSGKWGKGGMGGRNLSQTNEGELQLAFFAFERIADDEERESLCLLCVEEREDRGGNNPFFPPNFFLCVEALLLLLPSHDACFPVPLSRAAGPTLLSSLLSFVPPRPPPIEGRFTLCTWRNPLS